MKKYFVYIVVLLLMPSHQSYSQRKIDIGEYLNIISEVNNVVNDSNSNNIVTSRIDSVANSFKDSRDFANENNYYFRRIYSLGNQIQFKNHNIKGFLNIDYLEYNFGLLKIKYTIFLYKTDEIQVDTASLISFAKSINSNYEQTKYGINFTRLINAEAERFKKSFPEINLDISPIIKTKGVEFVNDPINKLTYGKACGVGGDSPNGFDVFASLVHYKEYSTLEKLLYSANPVARLYAADGLMFSSRKQNYTLNDRISSRISNIYSEEIEIHTCSGCGGKDLPIKYAKIELKEQMENPYENIIFTR